MKKKKKGMKVDVGLKEANKAIKRKIIINEGIIKLQWG